MVLNIYSLQETCLYKTLAIYFVL